jgi:hypothetical protein
VEIKEMETIRTVQQIGETRSLFYEKIEKTLAKLTKKKERRPKLIKLEVR